MCLSLVLISLSNTSLNVALPTLARDLRTGPAALQWIVDAYSLVFAGCLLTAGAVGDRIGRRVALNVGLTVFGLASAAAVVAQDAGQLIVARATMGVGAALIMPATLSVIAHVFEPAERARAIAIWAGLAGVGGAAGSVTSGWLLQHFWWGSIFIGNVVAVIAALVAGAFLVPPSRDETAPGLDPVGASLSMLGLAVLLYTLIEAPQVGWRSPRTIAGALGTIFLAVSFVLWEHAAAEPMLDLRLFRNPRFVGATTTITLIFFVMYGTVFVLTQYLQLGRGYTPLQAGIRVLPLPFAFMVSAPFSARLVERSGQRRVVCVGLALLAAGMALLAASVLVGSYPVLGTGLMMAAVGMGLTMAPSTSAIMAAVPLGKAGVASAVNDTTRELGGALGVALLGSVLTSAYMVAAGRRAGSGHSLSSVLLGQGAIGSVARSAFVDAVAVSLSAGCAIALVSVVVIFRVLRPRPTLIDVSGIRSSRQP